jgi:stage V sporulation protein B
MNKATKMAKVTVKGSFHLLWGLVASTVISAVGAIFIARLLDPSEYGIYTIAVTAPILISTFRDWGINSAVIRYVAQYKAENKSANVRSVLAAGLIFEVVMGSVLSALSFLLSGFLATSLLHRPDITPLIQIASFTILTGALMTIAQAAFTGIEKMELTSITLVCQSIIKTVMIPIIIILGLSAFGAVIGYTVTSLFAGLIGILLMWTIFKSLSKPDISRTDLVTNIKTMFKYGLPLSISTILAGFLSQFFNILMAIYATDLMIGNYSVASNFAILIGFFVTPVATMMFPAFSKLDASKDKETLRNVFQFSVKYAALLVVPAVAVLMALSQPGVFTLFGDKYTQAPLFLAILPISYLFTAFGSLSINNLISSQGQTKFNLELTILTVAIGFPVGFILISQFGIIGLLATGITIPIPSLIISLQWIGRRYGVTVDWASSIKILLSSGMAAAETYTLISQIAFSSWVKLIIGVIVFLFAYLIAISLTRTIDKFDLINLREMFGELGPLRRLFNFLLNILEKLVAATRP